MSLCPEFETRAAMSDDEFWNHIYPTWVQDDEPDYDQATNQCNPCPERGELGACAYDSLGRPMFHATREDDDD